MVNRLPLDVAVARFHRKVRPLLVKSDKQAMRNLYANLTADAGMEEGEYAVERMVGELRKALQKPHDNVRRNQFSRK